MQTGKATVEERTTELGQAAEEINMARNDTGPGNGTTGDHRTAAGRMGWGTPVFVETFADLSNWTLYSGEGHAGNGTREPGQISVSDNILTIKGAAGTAKSGGMALKGDVTATRRRYGRYEIRARSFYTDHGPTGGISSGGATTRTAGPGGVAKPAGATTGAGSTSTWEITSGGTASNPKVYDGESRTVGRIDINASHVVVQNYKIVANSQYGVLIDADDVTLQNCDIKGVKKSGDKDLNAITAFGHNIKILYNTAVDFVSGDPGTSHTDFIQTWVSDSHRKASSNWQIIGNVATGPANPDRDHGIASIHQWLMAEGKDCGGNHGGDGDPNNWVITDNTMGDSWNQAIKLDGVKHVKIARNTFRGSSEKVFEITDASSDATIYSDNTFGSGYGSVGAAVTQGSGPANPHASGSTTTRPVLDGGYHPVALLWPVTGSVSSGQGEYDFMENGEPGEDKVGAFLHYPTSNGDGSQQIVVTPYGPAGFDMREWHNFAIDWQPTGITLYVDGNLWAGHSGGASGSRLNIQDAQTMFLALQLDAFQADACIASTMQVAWVRVYDPDSTGTKAPLGGAVTLGPPKNLRGSFSGRALTLNWDPPTTGTASRYEVHEFLKHPESTLKDTIDAPATTRTSGQLQDVDALEYAVRAMDAAGHRSRYSNTLKASISGGVGTVEAGQLEGWDAGSTGGTEHEEPVDGTATHPSDLLKDSAGLVKWYLTTPEWDPDSPDETWNIEPGGDPDLYTFVASPEDEKRSYKLNAKKNGIVMSSDYEGSHTPRSTNTRMELRERDASNENIKWNTRSGTHRMVVVQQTDRLDGNHMVIAQIHGDHQAKDDLTVFRLKDTTLYITYFTQSEGTHPVDEHYQLGTPIAIAFSVNGSGTVSYYYKKLTATADLASYIANPEQIYSTPVVHTHSIPMDDSSYFKAGAYLQRKGEPGSWGQVTLYRAVCTHT